GLQLAELAELFSETPDAQCDEHQREDEQSDKIRPQGCESASSQHAAADDRHKMMNGIYLGDWLKPLGHRLDRAECARQRRQRRVDKETRERCLLRGLAERSDHRSDAYARQYAERAGRKHQQKAAVKRNLKDKLDHNDRRRHHQTKERKEW